MYPHMYISKGVTGDGHDVTHRPHGRQLPGLRGRWGELRPRTLRRPEPLQRQLQVLGLGWAG